jgi:hypothetical protein
MKLSTFAQGSSPGRGSALNGATLGSSRANHTSQRLRGAGSRLLQKFYSVKMPGQLWPLASFETSELCHVGNVFRLICFGWVNRCREWAG